MKVAVFVKATNSSEAGVMPNQQLLEEMGRYNEELFNAGIIRDGAGLQPTSKAVRVRFSGTDRIVIDGPFAETKELVAGYWLWEVPSMTDAVDWLKKCPNPMPEESEIEIRPLFEAEDFGPELTAEMREQESNFEAKVALQKSTVTPYLFFGGRCEEALEFYKAGLGAIVGMVMRFNESPDPTPEGMLAPGFENKIMHCEFKVGAMSIMASDGCSEGDANFGGFRLALSVPTAASADLAFNVLAASGKIYMPLSETFWSPRYGMVTDKFGVGWMVMVPALTHVPLHSAKA